MYILLKTTVISKNLDEYSEKKYLETAGIQTHKTHEDSYLCKLLIPAPGNWTEYHESFKRYIPRCLNNSFYNS